VVQILLHIVLISVLVFGLTLSHELLSNLQTDMIILDFSKAFDKVPHKKLLCTFPLFYRSVLHLLDASLLELRSPFVIDVLKMVVRCGANSAANCFSINF
jgi:hypothetical protein